MSNTVTWWATLCIPLAGPQMVLLLHHMAVNDAAELVERIRQTIEKTTFERYGLELQVTVSGGVIVAREGERGDQLLERLRATLEEAKRYGRNRTFLCEEDCPNPVVPPAMTIEEQTASI